MLGGCDGFAIVFNQNVDQPGGSLLRGWVYIIGPTGT